MNFLIVEGDQRMRVLLRKLARKTCPTDSPIVAEAVNASSALRLCSSFKPDFAILDLDLPDGDGLDLIPPLRARNSQVKILIISDRVTPEIVTRCELLNIDGFVDKPVLSDL